MESWLAALGAWAAKNSWVIGLVIGPTVIYYGAKLLRRLDSWTDKRWPPKQWPDSFTTYTRVNGPGSSQPERPQQIPPE